MKVIYWQSLGFGSNHNYKGVDINIEENGNNCGNYWYSSLKEVKKDFSPKEYKYVRIKK